MNDYRLYLIAYEKLKSGGVMEFVLAGNQLQKTGFVSLKKPQIPLTLRDLELGIFYNPNHAFLTLSCAVVRTGSGKMR